MATLDAMRNKRKKLTRYRLMASISQNGYESLLKLSEQEPEKNASQIISECLRFAFEMEIYKPRQAYLDMLKQERGIPSSLASSKAVVVVSKKDWCEQYGGTCDGQNCTFKRYEVTPTGVVVRNELTMPVRSMPDDEADFCKYVLGGFVTLSEAEAAFENQTEENFFDPSEIPSRKKIEK
jgi:hypothetical protein